MRAKSKRKKQGNFGFLAFIALVIFINLFIANITFVFGNSMSPTLNNGDMVVTLKNGYRLKKGDVVVTNTQNPTNQHLIKRVIATQGDTVSIFNGCLKVNDVEQVAYRGIEVQDNQPFFLQVLENELFLVGDNFNYSKDSRNFGAFKENEIQGVVMMRLLPTLQFLEWSINGNK